MRHALLAGPLLLCAAFAAGCSENVIVPTAADPTGAPGYAKGGGNIDSDPRARIVLDDTLSIVSDGKGAYQGDVCGVHAKVFVGGSGDLVFDPDKNRDRKCPDAPRSILFVDGEAQPSGAFMNVRDVWSIGIGETVSRTVVFDATGLGGCDRLVFAGATVTRTDDGSGARAWAVESSGAGTCRVWSAGAYVDNGTKTLPFAMVLEEVV